MLLRAFLALGVLLGLSLAQAKARELTIVARGPAMQTAVQSVFVTPFTAATGIAAVAKSWTGGQATLKTMTDQWDLVAVSPDEASSACSSGLLQKLDWSQVGGKDHYQVLGMTDCTIGATVFTEVLAWDRDKTSGTPTWADFWDVAKLPGKRGLRKGIRGNLEIALMADGVAPGDVYKILSTNDGVDRAFRKLDQLKPYIVWWQNPPGAAKILASGDVLMTSAPSDQIVMAADIGSRKFGVQWSDSLYEAVSWGVMKGSANVVQAMQYLYFSGTPAIQARMMDKYGLGGLAKGANELLPANVQALSPTWAGNLKSGLQLDNGFWQANLAKLQQRFDTWLAH
jgi:putative spermidine/putrescine transport system substrate-binding protein